MADDEDRWAWAWVWRGALIGMLVLALFSLGRCAWDVPINPTPRPPETREVVAEDDWSVTYKLTTYGLKMDPWDGWVPLVRYETIPKQR